MLYFGSLIIVNDQNIFFLENFHFAGVEGGKLQFVCTPSKAILRLLGGGGGRVGLHGPDLHHHLWRVWGAAGGCCEARVADGQV